ncbi:hypothetical protein A2U01_0114278, partial [Trifolium medium]|nr:hypothetical protein [Trifolium medium]
RWGRLSPAATKDLARQSPVDGSSSLWFQDESLELLFRDGLHTH